MPVHTFKPVTRLSLAGPAGRAAQLYCGRGASRGCLPGKRAGPGWPCHDSDHRDRVGAARRPRQHGYRSTSAVPR